jgi:transposase
MRKVHDVLRLHFGLKMPQRQIARSIQVSQSTVSEYLTRFEQSGLSWPLPEGFDDHRLQQKLFGPGSGKPEGTVARPLPDFEQIRHELATDRHTSLQLLWEEYREAHPDHPYSYTSFWRHYDQWRTHQDLVMRQEHRAGEKLFVDWAGAKIPIYARETGEVTQTSLFVAVLGASNYTYAEATASQEMEPWIGAHVRTFEFLGGLPQVVVPDNARTAVTKPCRYEPDLNPTYQEMAMHYGVGVVPARVRKPRDKAYVSYCTSSCLREGESRLFGASTALAF